MKDRDKLDDELREIAPFLADLKNRGDGRKVPEAYFDQFESSLFQKMKQQAVQRPKAVGEQPAKGRRIAFPNARILMLAAACISVLLAAIWFFKPAGQSESQPIALQSEQLAAQISPEELESYVLENLHEFDSEQLASISETDATPTLKTEDKQPPHPHKNRLDIKSEDITPVLDDMSDEELEQLL